MKTYEKGSDEHWITREGEVVEIRKMSDSHLQNTLRMLDRQGFTRKGSAHYTALDNEKFRRVCVGLWHPEPKVPHWVLENLPPEDWF